MASRRASTGVALPLAAAALVHAVARRRRAGGDPRRPTPSVRRCDEYEGSAVLARGAAPAEGEQSENRRGDEDAASCHESVLVAGDEHLIG